MKTPTQIKHEAVCAKYDTAAKLTEDYDRIERVPEQDEYEIWQPELHPRHDFYRFVKLAAALVIIATIGLYFGHELVREIPMIGELK